MYAKLHPEVNDRTLKGQFDVKYGPCKSKSRRVKAERIEALRIELHDALRARFNTEAAELVASLESVVLSAKVSNSECYHH